MLGWVACAVAPQPDAGAPAPRCECRAWAEPVDAGLLPSELRELSGLVASRTQPGVLYAHNDSGDAARFFALDTAGQLLATFSLEGARARDWEDVALGPCPAGTCLYLGDIGDNGRVREDYAVFRVPEPEVATGSAAVAWERLPYVFPGGEKHNAEALVMHATTGRLYLLTKERTGPSAVYRFPALSPDVVVELEHVATLPVPASGDNQLTGADLNVCGTSLLLRLYNRLVELRLPADAEDFEAIFSARPITVPVSGEEEQGEAVAWSADGRRYFTASERLTRATALFSSDCR